MIGGARWKPSKWTVGGDAPISHDDERFGLEMDLGLPKDRSSSPIRGGVPGRIVPTAEAAAAAAAAAAAPGVACCLIGVVAMVLVVQVLALELASVLTEAEADDGN